MVAVTAAASPRSAGRCGTAHRPDEDAAVSRDGERRRSRCETERDLRGPGDGSLAVVLREEGARCLERRQYARPVALVKGAPRQLPRYQFTPATTARSSSTALSRSVHMASRSISACVLGVDAAHGQRASVSRIDSRIDCRDLRPGQRRRFRYVGQEWIGRPYVWTNPGGEKCGKPQILGRHTASPRLVPSLELWTAPVGYGAEDLRALGLKP